MSSDNDAGVGNDKTTAQMDARDLHLHVLDLVLPAEWSRVTPQFWTKDHDSMETYEAHIHGRKVQVELKSDHLWIGRLESSGDSTTETDRFERQTDAVRALAKLLEEHA